MVPVVAFLVLLVGNGVSRAAEPRLKQRAHVELVRVIVPATEPRTRDYMAESCAFSADGQLLAASCVRWEPSADDLITSIRVWDMRTGRVRKTLKLGGGDVYLGPMVFLRGGTELVSSASVQNDEGFDGLVQIWDLSTGTEKRRIEFQKKVVSPIALSPDSRLLAVGTGGPDPGIAIWDIAKDRLATSLKTHGECVESLEFSPDGKLLVSSGTDGVVRIRDVATWRTLRKLTLKSDSTIFAMSPSKEDRIVAIAQWDDAIVLWNYDSGERVRKFVRQPQPVESMVFSPDGRMLITGASWLTRIPPGQPERAGARARERQVLVWDVHTGQVLASVPSHVGDVRGLACSPTGSVFATADFSTGALRLWTYHGEGAINGQETKKTAK